MRNPTVQMVTEDRFTVIRLLPMGVHRVLDGKVGMTFIVDYFSREVGEVSERIAHVLDFRTSDSDPAIWSIGPDGYEIIYSIAF